MRERAKMQGGANALSPSTSPDKRMPVIDRSKVDPTTLKAAEGMEAMFLDYMMKVMRETVPKNDLDLESPATNIYRGMMDSETAQRAAHAGGVGLADQIVAYLESQRYTVPREHAVPVTEANSGNDPTGGPTRRTGGTHEGQSIRK